MAGQESTQSPPLIISELAGVPGEDGGKVFGQPQEGKSMANRLYFP